MLLPGVTTLARLVARVSDEATQRLWDTLSELPTSRQRRMLVVADGARLSDLERWRQTGPLPARIAARVPAIPGGQVFGRRFPPGTQFVRSATLWPLNARCG